jgi:ribosomal protein S18 acetylase RimI-like enzyme
MQYKLMQPRHADQVAEIHIEGQPGTLLTKLGKPFLTTMYREICRSDWGFGVVAMDGEVVAGVGVLTTSTSRLFRDLKRRRGLQLVAAILPRLVTRPRLLLDVYQSWRYPAKMGVRQAPATAENGRGTQAQDPVARDPRQKDAEFLFLGVRQAYRGQKIASGLFDSSVVFCREREIGHLTALVEHTNWRLHQVASHHVARFGWRCVRQMELNGRVMDVIEIDLTHELAPEEWGSGTLDPDVLPGPTSEV